MRSPLHKGHLIIGGSIIIAALIFSYAYTTTQQPAALETTEPTYLYVQTAASGSLVLINDIWTLTLNDVAADTVYFSDRPVRDVGREPTAEFITDWNIGVDSFADTLPNAALDIIDSNGDQQVLVLELMSADYDPDTSTLVYDVIILDGDLTDKTIFDQAVLFIDSTYKHYTCGCELEDGDGDCQCKYDYTLGHGATKEFRVTCSNTWFQYIAITDRKKTTTCTIDFSTGRYRSKSCTNWHLSNSDTVTVKAICSNTED